MSEKEMITGDDSFKAYAASDIYSDNQMTKAFFGTRTFQNFDTNISVKSEYLRQDYDYFRVNEAIPERIEDRINLALRIYKRNGIVYNIINLMSEFSSQGIRIQHPNPAINRFYDTFAKKVNLKERSERMVNTVLKGGSAIIKKSTAKIGTKIERKWKKSKAEDLQIQESVIERKEVPIKYTIFSPPAVEVIGSELSNFIGKPIYAIKLPARFRNTINSMVKLEDKDIQYLTDQIPNDIKDRIKNNANYFIPDQSKIVVMHYKKDDNEIWAEPLISPVLSDLIQLDKYKLADNSALDGAISSVRLWNLGIIGDSPQNSILPTKAAINKLRNILSNNFSGGTIDLVYGPELKFTESNSQSWRWLGAEKYEPVWAAIYEGLGIPPSLRVAGKGSSGTGNYVGLNTLIKRLQYVRDMLTAFWTQELSDIHEAMGFEGEPPKIIYDFMVFADEAAEKKLWIDLLDRGIVSAETIHEVFGRYPKFETNRIKKEFRSMENGSMPDKASPFHNPDKDHELKKIVLQSGTVSPSEVGVELEPKKPGEEVPMEKEAKLMPKPAPTPFSSTTKKKKGGVGRPKNVKETRKRKPKPKGKPSTKAALFAWAMSSYDKISEMLNPIFLKSIGKSNMRKLTTEEMSSFELAKFGVLCDIEAFKEINEESVKAVLDNPKKTYKEVFPLYQSSLSEFISMHDKEPTIEEIRLLYSSAYATYLLDEESDDEYI